MATLKEMFEKSGIDYRRMGFNEAMDQLSLQMVSKMTLEELILARQDAINIGLDTKLFDIEISLRRNHA
jgi:hypothetical protein